MNQTRKYKIPIEYFESMNEEILIGLYLFHGKNLNIIDNSEFTEITAYNYLDDNKYLIYNTSKDNKVVAIQKSISYTNYGLDFEIIKFNFLMQKKTNSATQTASDRAKLAHYSSGLPSIASDTGFEIEELNGWPGNEYNEIIKREGINGIIKKLTKSSLNAKWVRVVAYIDNEMEKPEVFISELSGFVLKDDVTSSKINPKANILNNYFMIKKGPSKTVAELSTGEYNFYAKKDKHIKLLKYLSTKTNKQGV